LEYFLCEIQDHVWKTSQELQASVCIGDAWEVPGSEDCSKAHQPWYVQNRVYIND